MLKTNLEAVDVIWTQFFAFFYHFQSSNLFRDGRFFSVTPHHVGTARVIHSDQFVVKMFNFNFVYLGIVG